MANAPDEVRGFCFNIAETLDTYVIELVGANECSKENPDWPCTEDFRALVADFEVKREGAKWEQMLSQAKSWIVSYLAGGSAGALRLEKASAVAVGFVDGELLYVRP